MEEPEEEFQQIAWEFGERPNWWTQSELVWTFTDLDNRWSFTTSELKSTEHWIRTTYANAPWTAEHVLRDLFFHIPHKKQEDESISFEYEDVRLPRTNFIVSTRNLLEVLAETFPTYLESRAKTERYREFLKSILINGFEKFTEEHGTDFVASLFSPDSRQPLSLAVPTSEVRKLIKGGGAFYLEEALLTAERTREDERREKEYHHELQKGLREFIGDMKKSFWEPRTPDEEEAYRLWQQTKVVHSDSWNDEERKRACENFIIEHIIKPKIVRS